MGFRTDCATSHKRQPEYEDGPPEDGAEKYRNENRGDSESERNIAEQHQDEAAAQKKQHHTKKHLGLGFRTVSAQGE